MLKTQDGIILTGGPLNGKIGHWDQKEDMRLCFCLPAVIDGKTTVVEHYYRGGIINRKDEKIYLEYLYAYSVYTADTV